MILRPESAQEEHDAEQEEIRLTKLYQSWHPTPEEQAEQQSMSSSETPKPQVHSLEQFRLDLLSGKAGFGHTAREMEVSDGQEYRAVLPPNKGSVKSPSGSRASTSGPALPTPQE